MNSNNNRCEYCESDQYFSKTLLSSYNDELALFVDAINKRLSVFKDGELVTSFAVNYCPMCNRKFLFK